jgi:hypothetical protein
VTLKVTASSVREAQMTESVKSLNRLSLSEARKTAQLQAFVAEQEARNKGQILTDEFDVGVRNVIADPAQLRQTSDLPSHGGSTGKKTR